MALRITAEHKELMAVLERIAVALENLAYPYAVTFAPPVEPVAPAPHIPNPYWNPQPTYTPRRFDPYTGDPLPPRPENIC